MNDETLTAVDGSESVFEEAMSPPLTAEQLKNVAEGNKALEAALATEPEMMAELERVIGAYAGRPITSETISDLYNGLLYYLDLDSLDYLMTILTDDSFSPVLDVAEEQASPETWRWLRRLLALYGGLLREAYALSRENNDAWRWLNRKVYYDAILGRWGISLELIKLNGEKMNLEETPLSALGLALGIIDSMNSVPADEAPDLLEPAVVEQFMEQCTILKTRYTAEDPVEMSESAS